MTEVKKKWRVGEESSVIRPKTRVVSDFFSATGRFSDLGYLEIDSNRRNLGSTVS